jgi:hypothetical protein
MENASQPALWRDMFVVLSSSSAALIGLLFIATSLHLNEIVNNPILRRRAFNNTSYLLIAFVEALLILIPQPMPMLGAELIAINLLGLSVPLRFAYIRFKKSEEFHSGGGFGRGPWPRAMIFIAIFLVGIAGGATLFEHLSWGIYLVTTSCVILLVTVVLNAWSIMVGVGQTEKITKAN